MEAIVALLTLGFWSAFYRSLVRFLILFFLDLGASGLVVTFNRYGMRDPVITFRGIYSEAAHVDWITIRFSTWDYVSLEVLFLHAIRHDKLE